MTEGHHLMAVVVAVVASMAVAADVVLSMVVVAVVVVGWGS